MSRKALVIDDEPDTATYLGTLLSDNGWDVRTANDVNTGLGLAREDTPDVILLDLMMPERGGLSCLVELRKDPKLGPVPIVIVSGIEEELNVDFRNFLARFKYRKADAFLNKPVVPDELLKKVDELTSQKTE
jgi:CheY-like chemotaxis protein